ncbi:hypothetical protein ACFOWX_05390 [Sphingorhabdus arenilitoris]|uniref:Uncharacterized protein n=1 Tax=Sphingorhabdus arenilitoris TaxID=1490041 RepID=A0ABV8RFX9_9SPHN
MTHQFFIIASFAVTVAGLLWLSVSSYSAMRKSEALADDLKNER